MRKVKEGKKINDAIYNKLYLRGSKPGVIYGSPKVHKPNHPLRPILSAIDTFNYKIAKFFVPILKPFTFNNYTVKDH